MAVPSSGAISLLGIKRELATSNYASGNIGTPLNISLKECSDGTVANINLSNPSSDRPDKIAPHSMSEFYAYDQDYVSVTSFSGVVRETASSACGLVGGEESETLYHSGSGSFPGLNDIVYYNSSGTTTVNSSNVAFINGLETSVYVTTSSSGVVNNSGNCGK